jgi:hypothetical protein
MDDAEYLSRLQAAYFHLQALAEHLGNDPEHPLVAARELVAQVYMPGWRGPASATCNGSTC